MKPLRRRKSVRRTLTQEERWDLLGGRRGVFPSEAARRAAWKDHRETLLAAVNSGTRPAAWWDYESRIKRDPNRAQAQQLYAASVLSRAEVAEFVSWWTERLGKRLADVPPVGYRAPDPREYLRKIQGAR
jgi:hypothetical protein